MSDEAARKVLERCLAELESYSDGGQYTGIPGPYSGRAWEIAQDVRRAYPDMGVVQQLLGHSDPATTIALYGNYGPEDLERAMEAFAKALEDEI